MQPQPPRTRQSGPEAKKAPEDETGGLKPGGPILPAKQGFVNPGPTDRLRGVEPNTAMHRGEPNPHQHGTPGHIGGADHDPGMAQAGNPHGHGVDSAMPTGRTSEHGHKSTPPKPDPRGVRK
jgi:hypothetical protein